MALTETPIASFSQYRPETGTAPRRPTARQIVDQRRYEQSVKPLTRENLTGAASIFTKGSNPPESVPPPSATRAWQTEAWGFYDLVGEFQNAALLYGNCFRRCLLVPAIADEDGSLSLTFDDEAPETKGLDHDAGIIQELYSPYGGQGYLMQRIGVSWVVVGECFLYQNDERDGNAGTWEVLSTDELRPISSGAGWDTAQNSNVRWVRWYGPGFNPRQLPDDAYIVRMWRPHGRYSRHANSSARALLEILDEIVLLTREVRGETVSRISSAGILAVADEFDFPNTDDAQPDTEDFDPFTRELLETMMTAITDKESAAGIAPIVLRAPAELIDKGLKYLSFARPDAAVAMAKRREALERFAQGIELPPEWIFGHASTTFANAFQITDDAFRVYIEPGLVDVCENLTRGYLWPQLMKEAGLAIDDPVPPEIRKHRIWYDASHLIAKPDRTQDAKEAFIQYAISWKAYRATVGFVDADAPDEDEMATRIRLAQLINERVMIRGTDQNIPIIPDPALLQTSIQPGNRDKDIPLPIGTDPYIEGEDIAPGTQAPLGTQQPAGDLPTPAPVPGGAAPDAAPAAGGPAPKPADPPAPTKDTRTSNAGGDGTSHGADEAKKKKAALAADGSHSPSVLALRLHAASEIAVERVVDRVGAILKSRSQKNRALAERLQPIPNPLVAMEVGPSQTTQMLGTDAIAGEFAFFTRRADAWAREHGISKPGELAAAATAIVEAHARIKLFDPSAILTIAEMTILVEQAEMVTPVQV